MQHVSGGEFSIVENSVVDVILVAHCLISLLPRFANSAIVDLRTECKNPSASRQRPARISLYETQPSGVVLQAFKFFDNLINTCVNQIEACTCDAGCPSCEFCDKRRSNHITDLMFHFMLL